MIKNYYNCELIQIYLIENNNNNTTENNFFVFVLYIKNYHITCENKEIVKCTFYTS